MTRFWRVWCSLGLDLAVVVAQGATRLQFIASSVVGSLGLKALFIVAGVAREEGARGNGTY